MRLIMTTLVCFIRMTTLKHRLALTITSNSEHFHHIKGTFVAKSSMYKQDWYLDGFRETKSRKTMPLFSMHAWLSANSCRRNPSQTSHHDPSTFESSFLESPCSSAPSSSSRARFFEPASAAESGTAPGVAMVVSTAFSAFFVELSAASFGSSLSIVGFSSGLIFSSGPGLEVLTLGTPLSNC